MSDQKATAADAELILKLYDLRREPEMRKARNFVVGEFWPQSWDDMKKLALAFGAPENAWFRQVVSYWEMACSLVLRGALDAQLFFDNNGEMYNLYAKCRPFLKEGREFFKAPEFMMNIERVVDSTPESRARLQAMEQRLKAFVEMRKAAQSGSPS